MQMTNSELAEQLNAELGLVGPDAVTANVVRQWVAWDLLPKATAQGRAIGKGPVWSRSGAVMRRAFRLAELRQHGINRKHALIIHAYIEWGHRDFDRVRAALLREWAKWAAQLTRRQTTFLDSADYRNISATKKRALASQLGPLDTIFMGSQFQQSLELYSAIAEFSRKGEGDSNYITGLVSAALGQIYPGNTDILPLHCVSALGNSFAGMLGAPDEIDNSAENVIQKVSERQFRIARFQVRLLFRELGKGDQKTPSGALGIDARQLLQMLNFLLPQISSGPWLVFLFVQALTNASQR